MKKTLLFLFLSSVSLLSYGQTNLIVNPSFETWTLDTIPDGWNCGKNAQKAKIDTIFTNGARCFRTAAVATANFNQDILLEVGKTYNLSFDYKVQVPTSATSSGVRIYSTFKDVNGGTLLSANYPTTDLYNKLHGPGGSSSYLPTVAGQWQTFSTTFTVPEGYPTFALQCNLARNTTSYWDNFSLVLNVNSNIENLSSLEKGFIVKGNKLVTNNIQNGTVVNVFNTVGSKIQSAIVENNEVQLNNLSRGIYLVKIGSITKKVSL